jgi:DnaJ homolog subfamily C member 19
MNKREAARILGIRASADRAKLIERYRVLIKLNHPDMGGSPYLAKKINEAKDLLVKGKTDPNI